MLSECVVYPYHRIYDPVMHRQVRSDLVTGRDQELALLAGLVQDVIAGYGACVLVDGEAGVGKSALLAAAVAGADVAGCQVLRSNGDPLRKLLPLRILFDCLGVHRLPHDPHRAALADLLRGEWSGGADVLSGDRVAEAVERVAVLIERLCVTSPVILVLDDLQWADDPTLSVCEQLARMVHQLPLLVLMACRPVPRRASLRRLQRDLAGGVAGDRGYLRHIGPLDPDAVVAMADGMLHARSGPRLRTLLGQAAGNPLYVREMVDSLRREQVIHVADGVVEADEQAERVIPESLAAAIDGRLDYLSQTAQDVLRMATLLGAVFSASDLAVVLDRRPTELLPAIEEAIAAEVLVESDMLLAFRHGLIHLACYEQIPKPMRVPLHRQAARALAASGAELAKVAAQVVPSAELMDVWLLTWLDDNIEALTVQAPQMAVDLLERAVHGTTAGSSRHDRLVAGLVRAMLRLGRNEDATRIADHLLSTVADPERAAEMSWMVGLASLRRGMLDEGLRAADRALGTLRHDSPWRPRLRVAAAALDAASGRLDRAETTLREVTEQLDGMALDPADRRFVAGYCLHVWSLVEAYRGDSERVVDLIGRGLAALGTDPGHDDLRLAMRFNRLLSLQHLDRLSDSEMLAGVMRDIEQSGSVLGSVMHAMVAELYVRSGRWSEAVTEIESADISPDNEMAMLLCGGISAYIATHRGDWPAAHRYLDTVHGLAIDNVAARNNAGYLLMARAMAAEHAGQHRAALEVLAPTLAGEDAVGLRLRHLWLPEIVRLGQSAGDEDVVRRAVDAAERELAVEASPAKKWSLDRCHAMADGDPGPLCAAADYYLSVRQPMEAARSLEDAAVLFAAGGTTDTADTTAARTAFGQAIDIYGELGAEWDIHRIDARLRQFGVRRGRRGPRQRPTAGWQSLTPTELKVAELVARGWSNPDIANDLYLSRRTVKTHVSHILLKINARSRSEIASEVARHEADPPAAGA